MSRIGEHFALTVPGLTIRPARAEDDAFCRSLSDATLRAAWVGIDMPDELQSALLVQQFEAQRIGYRQRFPSAEYFIIAEREIAVGRLVVADDVSSDGLHDQSEPDAGATVGSAELALRLVDIALLPAAQGRGIGREVIASLARAALSVGAQRLTLSVQPSNDRARSLYLRLGFVETDCESFRQMTMRLD
ncbi:GNAT family N-acetyltransferase [Rhodopseudomonas palustris]|uniref:GNAT family N-acetyltransferase n=1 Tax=Rhodopseudomonas palustris TaxID=1076 RepID=UPI0021F3A5DE|nr:GNAT family N-acetyltransferase [Rhodopseudomonas palustris]UYO52164.1 GNAT family N-acetyltransferase [Rhodopseudomonas palustris]